MKTLKLKILSYDGSLFDGDVSSIKVPSVDGVLGILPEHIPLVTALAKGDLILHQIDDVDKVIPVDAGILDVQKEGVVIIMA